MYGARFLSHSSVSREADRCFARFEKSLYDLIRGLRNHKGNEKEYIQKSLKECRAEVRSQDMGSSTSITESTKSLRYADFWAVKMSRPLRS